MQDRIQTPDLSLLRSVGSFSGQPDEDVIKYISSYETECNAVDWPIGQYLRGIIPKLKGDAAAWHNIEGQCLTDWQDWKEHYVEPSRIALTGNAGFWRPRLWSVNQGSRLWFMPFQS